jgi:hypothetical protein
MARKNSATVPGVPAPADSALTVDTSDDALSVLLKRVKATEDPAEIRQLSDQIEQIIFHKQYTNA